MVHRIRLDQTNGLNLVPVAAIAMTTGRFAELGVRFDRGSDDLDDYEIAAYTIPGKGAFALMHYLHSPISDVTFMVEDRAASEASFVPMMQFVAENFDIPVTLFHWQVNGHEAHLAPAETNT